MAGAIGGLAGIAGLGGITSISSARSPKSGTVDIPKYKQRGEVTAYTTVPADWYDHLDHARRVNRKLQNLYQQTNGVVGIGLGSSQRTFGGKNGLEVKIQADPTRLPETLPSEVDGIPVTRVDAPEKWGPGLCTNVTDDLDVFGAEAYRAPEKTNAGSTCSRVFRDGAREMLTCAHTFWNDCNAITNSDITGQPVEQYDGDGDASDNVEYGKVTTAEKRADYAVFDDRLETSTDFRQDIDDNNGGIPVKGIVARDTLSSWASGQHIVRNMGCTTGITEGDVMYIDYSLTSNCTDLAKRGVYTYCNFGQGDSGGPTYDVNNGNAYMVSCTSYYYYDAGQCDGNDIGPDSAGVSASYISEQGIYFTDTANL